MRIALCNEVVRALAFPDQCAFASAVGYDALELAPFTLSDEPHLLPRAERDRVRRTAEDARYRRIRPASLFVVPPGLSITDPDTAIRNRTMDVMRRLVDLCADLGGNVLVHGSPAQRNVVPGDERAAWERARECWTAAARCAADRGVVYCVEPLSRLETAFINTVAEAAEMVRQIDSPALRTMIDTSAAGVTETESVPDLIDRWLPTGLVAHVQVNDRNRRGPGEGADRFGPVFAALRRHGYSGTVAVEPFEYRPDGPACAARAIGYIRGLMEASR